jgi:DNA-binding GntR family transcriptional regulator
VPQPVVPPDERSTPSRPERDVRPTDVGDGSRLTKRDAVAEALRREISSGQLAPGTRLLQHEVAARLGVSPTPVREAFTVLAHEGFIEWDNYRGVTVARENHDEMALDDLYELRAALEVLAVRRGASRVDEAAIRFLEEAERDGIEGDRQGDVERWRLASTRFHAGLVQIARSDLLNQVMELILKRSLYFPTALRSRVVREHQLIIDALKAGDAERAVELVAEHARWNTTAARKVFDSSVRRQPRSKP